jgi:hypothetical protein
MKYSVLISTRREPGLLAYLTGDLFHRGIFPDFLSSEALGSGSVLIRLEFDCNAAKIKSLSAYWQGLLRVQSVIVTPAVPDETVAPAPVQEANDLRALAPMPPPG